MTDNMMKEQIEINISFKKKITISKNIERKIDYDKARKVKKRRHSYIFPVSNIKGILQNIKNYQYIKHKKMIPNRYHFFILEIFQKIRLHVNVLYKFNSMFNNKCIFVDIF